MRVEATNVVAQWGVVGELRELSNRTDHGLLSLSPPVPMEDEVDTLRVVLDVNDDLLEELADDSLVLSGSCRGCIPEGRDIVGELANRGLFGG